MVEKLNQKRAIVTFALVPLASLHVRTYSNSSYTNDHVTSRPTQSTVNSIFNHQNETRALPIHDLFLCQVGILRTNFEPSATAQ